MTINCGDLIPITVEYTIAQESNGLRVTVAIDKAPMTFGSTSTSFPRERW